jgi:ubiquinone biosynthesis protein
MSSSATSGLRPGAEADERTGALAMAALRLQRFVLLLWKSLAYGLFPFADFVPFAPYRRLTIAVRVRRAIEEQGLTYLKLGQFLALRFDILPREVCEELNNLFENVPPMGPQTAAAIIEHDLGGPLDTVFAEFERDPIAAASVAQVHRATLLTGERVAVKVQRAGIRRVFVADTANLAVFAGIADRLGLAGNLSVRGMFAEFVKWTLRELDFTREGRAADRMAANAQWFLGVPIVYWDFTTPRVLTMEFIEGASASRVAELMAAGGVEAVRAEVPGFEPALALRRFAEASLKQLFFDGFFHGDPHPGNIIFRPGNTLAFIDYGITGALSEEEREIVKGQIENLALGNLAASFRYYAKQLAATEDTDFERFRREAMRSLRGWYENALDPSSPVSERHLARFTGEMIDVSRRNKLRYGFNYLLFWRAMNNLNATIWLIDPQYDLLSRMRAFFRANTPDAAERVAAFIEDERVRADVADLAGGIARDARGVLDAFSAERTWHVVRSAGGPPRGRDEGVRASAGAALSVSLAVMLTAGALSFTVRASIAAAVAGAFALASWRRA